MTYAALLVFFGLIPIAILWLLQFRFIWRYTGSLLVIVALIVIISVPWEMVSIDRIWYYSPRVLLGPHFLNLPVEELAFYAIDGLLVGSLTLLLREKMRC